MMRHSAFWLLFETNRSIITKFTFQFDSKSEIYTYLFCDAACLTRTVYCDASTFSKTFLLLVHDRSFIYNRMAKIYHNFSLNIFSFIPFFFIEWYDICPTLSESLDFYSIGPKIADNMTFGTHVHIPATWCLYNRLKFVPVERERSRDIWVHRRHSRVHYLHLQQT